jgi:transaldolase
VLFFLDTADINELIECSETGLVDGVTTNPSLIAKSRRPHFEILKDICSIIKGPVSAEVIATDAHNMYKEAMHLVEIAENIVIKLPITHDGIICCRHLSQKQIKTNLTLCFSESQALIAAKAGATYISPFVGRLDDTGERGMNLVENICRIYRNYNIQTKVLAASIRTAEHVTQAALSGADVVTMPSKIFKILAQHPLTDKGLEIFLNDWHAVSTQTKK